MTMSRFLGGPGREHFLKTSEYGKRERMTVVQGSPKRIQIALANKTSDLGDSQPCTRESVTGMGYWRKPDRRRPLPPVVLDFVTDPANHFWV